MDRKGKFKTQIVCREADVLTNFELKERLHTDLRKQFTAWAFDILCHSSSLDYKVTFSPLKLTRYDDYSSASSVFIAESAYEMHI